MTEFYGPTGGHQLGDPALDPPMTVRVQGGQDRAMRYSTTARRAIKTDDPGAAPWIEVAGTEVGWRFTDEQVRGWPVVAAVVNEAAYANWGSRAPREGLVQSAERGDMGVEAFRGER